MIFTKRETGRICRGTQTATLVAARKDTTTGLYRPPRNFRVGSDLAVQPGARQDEACRIVVTRHTLLTLGDLDFLAARHLGFKTQAEMAADWMDRYDPAWPLQEEAICETCDGHAVMKDGDDCPDCEFGVVQIDATLPDEQTLEIFRRKHGHKPVWLVSFELPADLPRYLANHSEHGYTTRTFDAMPLESEAVDEVTQKRFSKRARASQAEREAEDAERKLTATCVAWGVNPNDARARATVRNALVNARRRSA